MFVLLIHCIFLLTLLLGGIPVDSDGVVGKNSSCFNSWKQQSGETLERKTAILSAWSRNGAYELEANTSNLVDRKLFFFLAIKRSQAQ